MFGIVIDENGYKVTFVHLLSDNVIDCYTLKANEKVIQTDWQKANAMGKPRWTGTKWADEEPPEQIDNCLEVKSNQELTEENKLLKEQVKALTEANDFQEELIVEMAALVYA